MKFRILVDRGINSTQQNHRKNARKLLKKAQATTWRNIEQEIMTKPSYPSIEAWYLSNTRDGDMFRESQNKNGLYNCCCVF